MSTSQSRPSIVRINLTEQHASYSAVPAAWEMLGGRGLTVRILLEELDPGIDPLGGENTLVLAPGLLAGYRLSSCDRLSVGSKSPLTGGIKEANAGGRTAGHLARLGIKAVIIKGRAGQSNRCLLRLRENNADILPAEDLEGMGVFQTAGVLLERFGSDIALALIGPAGEMGLRASGIQNVDKDGVPSRMAARGGLGAVMGKMGLKAIIVDPDGASGPPIGDSDRLRQLRDRYHKAVLGHPQTKTYHDYGTAAMTMMSNTFGALPTKNFTQGEFEGASELSGEHLREQMLLRGKSCNPSHACMVGCVIQSSNVYTTADGKTSVSALEYETLGLMGSNLGLSNADEVAQLNAVCNDLGLDTIEIGAALGIAAEAGTFKFGDCAGAKALLEEIPSNSPLGRALGHGAAAIADFLGVERVPVVKGQALSAYDPRAIKGTGVTYATSPQGADHTAGLTIRAKIDHLGTEGQVEISRNAQFKMAGYDSLGACIFASFGFGEDPQLIPELIEEITGNTVGENFLVTLGKETIRLEREFNLRAGFTSKDDRLPEWMRSEPLPPHNALFDVSDSDLDSIFDEIR